VKYLLSFSLSLTTSNPDFSMFEYDPKITAPHSLKNSGKIIITSSDRNRN
jgi:hypothetical protein